MTAKIPASIRSNNPGAMEPGWAATQFGSVSHEVLHWKKDGVLKTNKIAIFEDAIRGGAAQMALLASKGYAGLTVEQAISKWCGGFWASDYILAMEKSGVVTRTTKLTRDLLLNPEVAIPICRTMAAVEAGQEFPLDEAGWRSAHALAFAGTAPEAAVVEASKASPVTTSQASQTVPVVAVPAPAKPLTKSGTLIGVYITAIGVWLESVLQFGLEWVAAVASLKPIQGLLGEAAGNPKALSTAVMAGGLSLVLTRRVKAKQEGRKG